MMIDYRLKIKYYRCATERSYRNEMGPRCFNPLDPLNTCRLFPLVPLLPACISPSNDGNYSGDGVGFERVGGTRGDCDGYSSRYRPEPNIGNRRTGPLQPAADADRTVHRESRAAWF